jgi:hypothetical protein
MTADAVLPGLIELTVNLMADCACHSEAGFFDRRLQPPGQDVVAGVASEAIVGCRTISPVIAVAQRKQACCVSGLLPRPILLMSAAFGSVAPPVRRVIRLARRLLSEVPSQLAARAISDGKVVLT